MNINMNVTTTEARFTIRTFLPFNLTRNKEVEQSFVRMSVRSVPVLSCPVYLELHLQIVIINLFFLFYWNASSTFLYGKETFCPKYCTVSTFILTPIFFPFLSSFLFFNALSFLLFFFSLLPFPFLPLLLYLRSLYYLYLISQYYYNYFTSLLLK